MASTKDDIANVLKGTGTKTIGAMVYWSLSGVDIPRDVLREELVALKLDRAMGRDPRPSTMLSTAVQKAQVGAGGWILRKIGSSWAIVVEQKTPERLNFIHALTVRAGEKTGLEWTTVDALELPGGSALLAAIKERVEVEYEQTRRAIDTSELSAILVAAVGWLISAIGLRERSGGLYFVHGRYVPAMRELKALVERLAPACDITVMTLTGDDENLAAAARAARSSFSAQLQALKDEIGEFTSQLKGGKEATDRNYVVRADKLGALADRVELFRDILGGITGELTGEIEAARAQLATDCGLAA